MAISNTTTSSTDKWEKYINEQVTESEFPCEGTSQQGPPF